MNETITIKHGNETLIEAIVNPGSTRVFELMGEDYISVKFSMARSESEILYPPVFHVGDYCDVDGERFIVNEHYAPTYNKSTGGYDYSLQMDAEYRTFKNYLVKNAKLRIYETKHYELMASEVTWKYTAQLHDHVKHLLVVLALHGKYSVDLDTEEGLDALEKYIDIDESYFIDNRDKMYKVMEYDGTNIIEALESICGEDKYNCEWWATRGEDGCYIFHFGKLQFESAKPKTIETAVNANSITLESSKYEYANRLYVFGGTHNVPYSYRKSLIFTNTRRDGIYDDNRPLAFDAFTTSHRVEDYDVVLNGGYISTEDKNEAMSGVYSLFEAFRHDFTLATIESLPDGQYDIDLSKFVVYFQLDTVGYGKYNKATYSKAIFSIVCNVPEQYGDRTIYEDVVDLEIQHNENSAGDYAGSSAEIKSPFPNIRDVSIPAGATNIRLVVSIETGVHRLLLDSPTRLEYQAECFTGGAKFTRVDLYHAETLIKCGDYESIADFWKSDRTKQCEIVPRTPGDIQYLAQYTISNLKYTKIPMSYYTSDEGDDVINGLSELRLRLPLDLSKIIEDLPADIQEGYAEQYDNLQRGYIQRLGDDEIVEASFIHEDIYPSNVSMKIARIEDSEAKAELLFPDASASERMYPVYTIHDTYINNDPANELKTDYILSNVELQVKFNTGLLAGMMFKVQFDELDQSYLIIPNSDYGALLPDKVLVPQPGDEILLVGWDVRAIDNLGMIETAEARLLAAALDDLENSTEGSKTYRAELFSRDTNIGMKIADSTGALLVSASDEILTTADDYEESMLQVGEMVVLKDYSLFGHEESGEPGSSRPMRVIGYEKKLDIEWDSPRYTIGEIPKPSRLQILENTMKS